jgi:arsenate reductase-like glutaredoxin family protein
MKSYHFILKSEYDEISDFIKTKVKENEVISLPKNLSAVIFRETLIPQLNPKTYIFTYIGDREIFERNIVDMKLQGFDLEEVKSIVANYIELLRENPTIYELRGIMGEIGIPIEKPQNKKEIQEKFLEEFEELDRNKLKELINKFEVKYVIRKREKTESEFFLKEIYRTKKFYVYEVRIDI